MRFFDNWAYDRKFNSQYALGFVDCLLELIWVQDRMLAAKISIPRHKTYSGTRLILKNKPHLKWFFNWCKLKPSILLKIIQGTIQKRTDHNESESVMVSLEEFMDFKFKSWLCICENEYLKLIKVPLFETGN